MGIGPAGAASCATYPQGYPLLHRTEIGVLTRRERRIHGRLAASGKARNRPRTRAGTQWPGDLSTAPSTAVDTSGMLRSCARFLDAAAGSPVYCLVAPPAGAFGRSSGEITS